MLAWKVAETSEIHNMYIYMHGIRYRNQYMEYSMLDLYSRFYLTNIRVSQNGSTPKWMVYHGKSQNKKMDDLGVPHFRKPPYTYKWHRTSDHHRTSKDLSMYVIIIECIYE